MDGFIGYAMCYQSINDDLNGGVILEDLNACGSKIINRFTKDGHPIMSD